jgi:outer membrane protein
MKARQIPWLIFVFLLMMIRVPSLARALTLGESVQIAMQENDEIKAMEEKRRGAKYGVMESVGSFLPSLNISTAYTRAEGGREFEFPIATRADLTTGEILYEASVKTGFLEEEAHDTKLEVVQPIFQGGALWSQLGVSRAKKRAAEYELLAKRFEIALRVQDAYYGILEAEQMVKAMEEAVGLSREHVRVAQALYETGMTGRAEPLRADVLLSSTLQDRLRAENGLILAQRTFNSLLNRSLDHEVSVAEAEELAWLDLTLDQCIQQAFAENPGLRSFQEQLKVAGKSVSLVRSGFLPNLNLIFDYGWHENKYRFDADSDFWMVMGVASWDLFTSGRNLARYKQSKAGYRQLEHELKAFREGLKLSVTQAYLGLQEARNSLDLAERALASAKENYRVTEASYREGIAAQVDEIDAQVTLTESRVNHARTRYGMFKAQSRLENLMGMMPDFN